LGAELASHEVRGTSRTAEGASVISAAGFEGVVADPLRLGTLLPALAGVTVVVWLFGRVDSPELHGDRLSALLEKLVDSGVRGFVYEDGPGAPLVLAAGERWRMPVAVAPSDGLGAAVESVMEG
jgi:uncharacterized protein YbjT (DUF2867 family)